MKIKARSTSIVCMNKDQPIKQNTFLEKLIIYKYNKNKSKICFSPKPGRITYIWPSFVWKEINPSKSSKYNSGKLIRCKYNKIKSKILFFTQTWAHHIQIAIVGMGRDQPIEIKQNALLVEVVIYKYFDSLK